MRVLTLIAALLALPVAGTARAQGHDHASGVRGAASLQSPYVGLQHRAIKALSDQQVEDLRAGRGMGLALAAELNGYPGPLHSLELADQLRLSPDQQSSTAAALEAMRNETKPLGEAVILAEGMLDRLFADRTITPDRLDAAVLRIAAAQGRLRAAHLRYHLRMKAILTPDQDALYARLRGYAAGPHGGPAPP